MENSIQKIFGSVDVKITPVLLLKVLAWPGYRLCKSTSVKIWFLTRNLWQLNRDFPTILHKAKKNTITGQFLSNRIFNKTLMLDWKGGKISERSFIFKKVLTAIFGHFVKMGQKLRCLKYEILPIIFTYLFLT